ncbi:hypothetical protein SDC9_67621 [bioreactor metagenome]|uniref:Uncharacterized protein n=1 Tax=bioreactor metagenome TaxID=1076179 RepID=A0A644XZH7_9ZZZZ
MVLSVGGKGQPANGGLHIFQYALTAEIQLAEPVCGKVIVLSCRQGIEPHRLCDILRNVLSLFIELAKKICGIGILSLNRFSEVAEGFLHILRRCFFIGEDEFGKLIAGKGVSH